MNRIIKRPAIRPSKRIAARTSRVGLDRIATLSIAPGDTLVLTTPNCVSEEDMCRIRRHFLTVLPDNKVIVLDGGSSLSVLRTSERDQNDLSTGGLIPRIPGMSNEKFAAWKKRESNSG